MATDVGTGIALFIDEMQDLSPTDVSALCAACHELSQTGAPLIVVGAGLPHLPAAAVGREVLLRAAVPLPAHRPARPDLRRPGAVRAGRSAKTVEFEPKALDALYEASGGYPYFVQAYGKATWDHAPQSPITAADVRVAAPEAEAELAVGFFGSRYERATPAEREYMRAMAALSTADGDVDMDAAVPTAEIARALDRKPASLSPGPGRADQEGPDLLRRARHGRVHRPALRPLPAHPAGTRVGEFGACIRDPDRV